MDGNSFFTNLKNKILYHLNKAVYDKDANQYVEEQQQAVISNPPESVQKTTATIENTSVSGQIENTSISGQRILSKIIRQFLRIARICTIPFIALMMAMIVSNEMIVYTVPIRIIFFIFTLIVVYIYPIATVLLPIFYMFKGGYSYFINKIPNQPKQHIMPTIYALLPVTTNKPTSSFWSFILYPFTYPKVEKAAETLPEDMNNYWQSLIKSFTKFKDIENLPEFSESIKIAKNMIDSMHDQSKTDKPLENKTDKTVNSKTDKPLENKTDKTVNSKTDKTVENKTDKTVNSKTDNPAIINNTEDPKPVK
jgi:hypothetical protein